MVVRTLNLQNKVRLFCMQILKSESYPLYSGITKDVKRTYTNINECDLHSLCSVEGLLLTQDRLQILKSRLSQENHLFLHEYFSNTSLTWKKDVISGVKLICVVLSNVKLGGFINSRVPQVIRCFSLWNFSNNRSSVRRNVLSDMSLSAGFETLRSNFSTIF